MNEIYPQWIEAHGVLLLTPVNWYHASSPMKLMSDRLVCADGGNPDPTTTAGKDAAKAKAMELAGWDYPRPLSGRRFGVVVHGDAEGARGAAQDLAGWLEALGLVQAGPDAVLHRYIGYFEPYATSHEALDQDRAVQIEVENVARVLRQAVSDRRSGRASDPPSPPKPRDK